MAPSRNNNTRKRSSNTVKKKPHANTKHTKKKKANTPSKKEELFTVDKIIDSKIDKNGVHLFKVRWKGYSSAYDSWEPTENVSSTGVSVHFILLLHFIISD